MADLVGTIVGGVVSEVEVRTTIGGGRVRTSDLVDGTPSHIGPLLKPTVIVRDGQGRALVNFAPYGEAPDVGPLLLIAAAALLVGLGYLLAQA